MQCLNPDQAFGLMQHMLPKDKLLTNPAKVYKERKKHDRFNGMPEEEVSKRTLPDHLTDNLDIVIVSVLYMMIYNLSSIVKFVYLKNIFTIIFPEFHVYNTFTQVISLLY